MVLDENDCMVDISRYFLGFTQSQSCGRCTFCRVGTRRMLDLLEKVCEGRARAEDLTTLEELAALGALADKAAPYILLNGKRRCPDRKRQLSLPLV